MRSNILVAALAACCLLLPALGMAQEKPTEAPPPAQVEVRVPVQAEPTLWEKAGQELDGRFSTLKGRIDNAISDIDALGDRVDRNYKEFEGTVNTFTIDLKALQQSQKAVEELQRKQGTAIDFMRGLGMKHSELIEKNQAEIDQANAKIAKVEQDAAAQAEAFRKTTELAERAEKQANVERAWLADPTNNNPRPEWQFSKWADYEGSQRLGLLIQRCGQTWPSTDDNVLDRVTKKLDDTTDEVGAKVLKTCDAKLLGVPLSPPKVRQLRPAGGSEVEAPTKTGEFCVKSVGCFGEIITASR